ncbi:hypothetical protein AwDysgo_21190 [Bacteroidales bacterium]|nr:hypothetical protein AwDysgo_21190 [Bacteroidales bacterium]
MEYKITLILIGILIFGGCNRSPQNRTTQGEKPDKITETELSNNSIVNVYVENSGSMNGYVNGNTKFKEAVYNYLTDIKISGLTEEINLYYINSQAIKITNEIEDFINKLNPASFKNAGGNLGASDISDVLKTILSKTTDELVSVMISDCIFSPGKQKDADQYLINQQIGIKANVAEYLKTNSNVAICVYQLSSQFDGYYYNRHDARLKINATRPFYIWLIGNKENVSALLAKIPMSKFKGSGIENTFTLTQANQKVDYAIRPGTGKFKLDKLNSKTNLVNFKKGHNGNASFSVNVNFSNLLVDSEYLKNASNYILNDKDYQLNITDAPANSLAYTHSLNFTTEKVKPSNLSIKLRMSVPEWVEEMNDNEGLDINKDEAMNKTYGIKYLVNGIYEAFTQHSDFYSEIKISINN